MAAAQGQVVAAEDAENAKEEGAMAMGGRTQKNDVRSGVRVRGSGNNRVYTLPGSLSSRTVVVKVGFHDMAVVMSDVGCQVLDGRQQQTELLAPDFLRPQQAFVLVLQCFHLLSKLTQLL